MSRISRLLLVLTTSLVVLFASVGGAFAATSHQHAAPNVKRHAVRAHAALVGYDRFAHGPR
jgi:hypothetical protein